MSIRDFVRRERWSGCSSALTDISSSYLSRNHEVPWAPGTPPSWQRMFQPEHVLAFSGESPFSPHLDFTRRFSKKELLDISAAGLTTNDQEVW